MDVKETCMGFYNKACRFTESGDFEEAAVNIRHALEEILKEFIRRHAPEHIYDDSFKQIEALKQTGLFTESKINIFHNLRILGNRGGHVDSSNNITKQELEDALPVLKSTIEFCCTPPTQNMHSANQKRTHQVARPGEDTIQYLKKFFSGRILYTEPIIEGQHIPGVKASFNNDIFELEMPGYHIKMHVIGINEYNIFIYDEAYINGHKLGPNELLIKITSLTIAKDDWGKTYGSFWYEMKCAYIPAVYKRADFKLFDEWRGQQLIAPRPPRRFGLGHIFLIIFIIIIAMAQAYGVFMHFFG